ncbi:hypothetical protein Tco_0552443, partial [Tanacetum coccineum]
MPRFVISSDSSHHSGANIGEAEVDSFARPSVLLKSVATTVSSLVDGRTCREMVDEFAPLKFFALIH